MLLPALVRQYAVSQQIDLAVADQEIVLHYVLALLNAEGLIGVHPGSATTGPLLFKGGTALRKCVFGSTGRFSEDVNIEGEGDVYVTFTLTTPVCPIGPQVSEQMKEFVGDLDGVKNVYPKMIFDPPWSPEMMAEEAKFALWF